MAMVVAPIPVQNDRMDAPGPTPPQSGIGHPRRSRWRCRWWPDGWTAHVYLHVNEVFVADVDGNLIGLGMFVGLANWAEVWPSAAAIAAFVAGVAVGTQLNRRPLRYSGPGRTPMLFRVKEAAMLAVLAVVLLVTPGDEARHGWPVVSVVICVGAAAMGMQAAALGRVGSIAVTTTYGTGSLVHVGQNLVPPAAGVASDHSARNRVVRVLASLLSGYVGAAAISALLGGAAWLMTLPVVALALTAWWASRHPGTSASMAELAQGEGPLLERVVDRRGPDERSGQGRGEAHGEHRHGQGGHRRHLDDQDDAGERRPDHGGEERRHADRHQRRSRCPNDGSTTSTSGVANAPHSAPTVSSGAKSPPGAPVAYDSGPARNLTNRYPSNAGTSSCRPASNSWLRASPPPTDSGSTTSATPMTAPMSATRATGPTRVIESVIRRPVMTAELYSAPTSPTASPNATKIHSCVARRSPGPRPGSRAGPPGSGVSSSRR